MQRRFIPPAPVAMPQQTVPLAVRPTPVVPAQTPVANAAAQPAMPPAAPQYAGELGVPWQQQFGPASRGY